MSKDQPQAQIDHDEKTLGLSASPPEHEPASLEMGQIVAARYKLESLLGRGAMGSVYLVQQIFLNKKFALKTIHRIGTSETQLKRFQKEAQAASKLDHPNLVRAVDYGMLDETRPFLVMDYVQGQTLQQYLSAKVSLSVEEALKIFIPLCFAMAYAHQEGIIHRDIKPSNIVLVPSEQSPSEVVPKIVDFGIAKLIVEEGQDLTKTGEVVGTPLYMSPEQCSGTKLDERSDIYSLGCVLYEALTGGAPFRGNSPFDTMIKHLHDNALPLKEASLGQDFPPALEAIVQKMLAKNADQRYQSFLDVTKDLARLQHGLSEDSQEKLIKAASAAKIAHKQRASISTIERSAYFLVMIGLLTLLVYVQGHRAPNPSPTASRPDSRPEQFLTGLEGELDSQGLSNYDGGYSAIRSEVSDDHKFKTFHFPRLGSQACIMWSATSVEQMDKPEDARRILRAVNTISVPNQMICFGLETPCSGSNLLILRQLQPKDIQGLYLHARYRSQFSSTIMFDDALNLANSLDNLQYLFISGPVSKSGIDNLVRFPHLRSLDIEESGGGINGSDLTCLKKLKELRLVRIRGVKNAAQVTGLLPKDCYWLDFENCDLIDSDLTKIANTFAHLQVLSLKGNTKVSEKKMEEVTKLTELKELYLNRDQLSPEISARIRKALPHCLIKFDSKTRPLKRVVRQLPFEPGFERLDRQHR